DNSSTSSALTQTVNKATPTVTLTSSSNPSTYGGSVTFTATLSISTATGTVTFKNGSTTLGTGTVSSGIATYSTSTLAVGSNSITAAYGGDTNDNSSTSSALTQTVSKASPTVTLASSSNPSAYGSSVTFTATLSITTATGTVTFKNGSTTLGTGTVSGGQATYSTSSLAVGSDSITASYGGDSNDNSSTSSTLTQVVEQASSVALASSVNPSLYGAAVTFTATVTPSAATGTVTFYDGSTALGAVTISSGVATYGTSTLASGSNSITAVYGGSGTYSGSTSAVLTQSVLTVTSISVTPATVPLPIAATQQFTATATYSSGTQGNVTSSATWSSSAANVVNISSAGVATGISEGTATIEATVGTVAGSASVTGTPSMFRLTGSLITPRVFHTETVLQNGQVLITGGEGNESGSLLGACELYNPTTGTFSSTGNLNVPRLNHTATLLANGTVLITGGQVSDGSGSLTETAISELYNPATGTFAETGSLNAARASHTATLLGNGMVLIAGGTGLSGEAATAELYNPATSTFTTTGTLNTPRDTHTATLLNDGTVLIAGGENSDGGTAVAVAELYNSTTGAFTTTGSLNTASIGQTATLLNTGQVLIAGGYTVNFVTVSARTELYNPTTKLFTASGNMSTPRALFAASLLSSGNVLLVGGVDNNNDTLASADLYNATASTFSIAGDLNNARTYHTAALLTDGAVLIAGGQDANGYDIAAAETYQGNATPPAPFTLQITPVTVNILVGGAQQFTAVDNNGIPRPDATWTISNTSVATISTNANGTGIVTGVAAGQVTLTATAEGVSAQEQVTILSTSSYSVGAAIWSAPPPAGFSVTQLAQAVPSVGGPDLYSISLSSDGTQSIIQALQADGEQLWQTTMPPMLNNAVPDGFGGLIVTTCASGSPLTVVDVTATGQPVWELQSAEVSGYGYICYAPQIAVDGNGVAYITEPTNAGLPSVTFAYPSGDISSFQFPPSIVGTIQVPCCVGPPMVNVDGTLYVEYEVRNTSNNVITSDTLYLYSSTVGEGTVLSTTTQNEALLPGPIIPDGNGGILATWTISPSLPPVPQYPYQAADVSGGVVGAPYSLPFSPPSVTFGQSPTFVLGDTGEAFATDGTNTTNGPQIVSFNPISGGVNWAYQASTQTTLSLIASTSGGGITAKTTVNGSDTVIRFSSTGTSTTDSWSGGQVAYYIGTLWTGTPNNTVQTYSAPPVEFSSSPWFQPQGGGQGNGGAIPALNVTGFSSTGANQTTIQNVLNTIVTALALPANSGCASWLVGQATPDGPGPTGTSYIQSMLQNAAFGHGVFNKITTWAFTGFVPNIGVPDGIAMVVNDSAGFFNATAPNGGSFIWGPSKFIYTTWDTVVNTPVLKPPQYQGGSLKAQVATLIHETAHGISVEFFQSDSGIQKAGYFNDQFLYQNCHGLIDGIQ
ncbi:MAG: Ig-like domain repeat protein, partial [Candidatus Sulfotelmatobacter sp.]